MGIWASSYFKTCKPRSRLSGSQWADKYRLIPYELLVKNFTASYSASRASLLEAWKMFRMRREWLIGNFCQPVYEEWLTEAVVKGRKVYA